VRKAPPNNSPSWRLISLRFQLLHFLSALLAVSGWPASVGWITSPGFLPALETGGRTRLTYSKTLKGSVPEYLMITVDGDGASTYEGHELSEPPNARSFQLSAATTRRLFQLAERLNYFRSMDLESHKKVANLGMKIFTYQGGGQETRVEFNYTQNRIAQELLDCFENIASVQERIARLEYAIKYDHLDLPKQLLQIQIDLDNKALADPELLVPALAQIIRNPRFLHLAQTRAQDILRRVQTSN
jgi:hypothetical protein